MKSHKRTESSLLSWLLVGCYSIFFFLSWILVLRDPRAVIGIGNLYPALKETLFALQTQAAGYGINSIPTILFAVVSLTAFVLYFISLKHKINLQKTIIFAFIFQAIALLSFPILSTDIFSYIMSHRVTTVHEENIWHVKPAAFPDDQFAVMADWKDTTSVYGAMHYLLYLGPSLIGQNDLTTLVLLFKLISVLFGFGLMYVFYKLLVFYEFKDPAVWIRFLFWNPLFIVEIFGSGHNDVMMLFFALLAWYMYVRNYWVASGVTLALAVQIKLIPLVLFFYSLLRLVKNKQLKPGFVYALGFFGVNIFAFLFMQTNVQEFLQRVAYNGGVYWQSLPTVLQALSPPSVSAIPMVFILFVIGYTVFRLRQEIDPLQSYTIVILVYLLFVSSAYWNWYILWILPFVPFIKNKNVFILTLLLTFTSLFAYPLLWSIHRINTPSFIWPILQYVFIFGPGLLVYILLQKQNGLLSKALSVTGINNLIAEKPKNSV